MVGSDHGKRNRQRSSAPPSKPTVESLIDSVRKEVPNHQQGSGPLFLPRIRTEYDRLCEDFGGPADIGRVVNETALRAYCSEYGPSRIIPILVQFQGDATTARRYWPWAACAISIYVSELQTRKKYTDELKPEQVEELISQIEQSARKLSSGLCSLQVFSQRQRDWNALHRRGHLAWLNAFVSQAAAGFVSQEVIESGPHQVAVETGKMDFLKRLAEVEAAAQVARKLVDRRLLIRERGQTNPALPSFVFRCRTIWEKLTGRVASANKVHSRRGDSEDPDFVIFVQKLAKIGGAPVPSPRQVDISLRKIRTTN